MKVLITDAAMDAIRAAANDTFRQTGVKFPDGGWVLDLDPSVVDTINSARLDGETFSDAVERVVVLAKGKLS